MARVQPLFNSPPRSRQPLHAGRSSVGAQDTVPTAQPVDRLLSCIAGFYQDERQARHAAEQIGHEHGLALSQMVLLSPRDAPRKHFSRLASLWAGHWPAGHQSVVDRYLSTVLLGLALLILAGWMTVLWWDNASIFGEVPTVAWLGGPLGLALVAAWLLHRQHNRPHVRRFESRVQQQLALGHWALVVCKLPWTQQASVLALMRAGSLRWCAVAEPSARI